MPGEKVKVNPLATIVRGATHERCNQIGQRAFLDRLVDGAHETVGDRLLQLVAVDALLARKRFERLLAAQGEDEILARDDELARDAVDRS